MLAGTFDGAAMLGMIERWWSGARPSRYSAHLVFVDVDVVQEIFFLEIWLEVDIGLFIIQQVGNVVFFELDGSATSPGAARNGGVFSPTAIVSALCI
ncbi:hypothetical protein KSF_030520 [Reticulibacter mediterranei]|uniref:Uncharacterized protein n=1 Tax=Reticulibacter mediterranei TaxID=2778369 RepID=A0A8J3IKA9_9CHLR|nr:hypothetical protein KSF_030520 [Reticulibacter mediterranei]